MTVKRALISVSNKDGIVEFASGLVELGVEIISTGGTLKALREGGIDACAVSDITGFPECLDGRVKTLHPHIHAAVLARRDRLTHMDELRQLGIKPIDLVVVNLYPFQQTAARADTSLQEALDNIDIGGPTMIRAAAKNYIDVAVVVDPLRYRGLLKELKVNNGCLSLEVRRDLAVEAFNHTAQYDAVIQSYLAHTAGGNNQPLDGHSAGDTERDAVFSNGGFVPMILHQKLRYGENPHQRAAFYREPYPGEDTLAMAKQLHGKELSFNNINDGAAALEMVKMLEEPAVVAIKHANPCGWAIANTLADAYQKAYDGDPVSIFGGIVACNRSIDVETAGLMSKTFLEVIIAPGFDEEALAILRQKKNLRLLELPGLIPAVKDKWWDFKRIKGGWLVQEVDPMTDDKDNWRVVTTAQPTNTMLADLTFGWQVVKFVKSNAIVIAKDGMTLGVGAGQMNRVEAASIALKQAGEKAKGAILASDAFFPFDDVVKLAAEYNIAAIIQPGGSIRDEDSVTACDEAGIAMIFTGRRHFRH
ncbi:MAG: bifunctional phosphoribosylaminoimidazolecarboxamide formyltransferase/IMP cyclohydrolase [Firmicutes bacterium]|nr:bifunctional phosphoribosylaminoimidazolecarboxamide formyltransferase/IMP cyclohydrolase [Bacillota bacterium]